jgi:DNA-binding PadR family transcriptional regulator
MSADVRARVQLSDLECCILGAVWQRGPCSAYRVQKEFAASVTSYWSASAGSIYPALRRLQKLGCVSTVAEKWGRSSRTLFSITDHGTTMLRAWIEDVGSARGAAYDPLRTRIFFLDALPSASARLASVETALRDTERLLDELQAMLSAPEPFRWSGERMSMEGACREVAARAAWLREVKVQLEAVL